ncbi:transcriptional regulator [Mesorhizobium sp.]|jgi:transcriptional regulator with XRE-family HTH domain|uniref:helix-turn-helix domain-containing protein n=1 Tax=Mesorhizobium sp. TaxID=1871066 RepID=UPI000FE67EC2|nr:transcriptional regulator [Mesorhizobium sp.]RWO24970.1 MAG: XRE family transcriptional regulator [Mesorhizobium sp.]TIL29929.1 MAG: helix-turn-helix transcriptional regulator [Mesorhizobium sp.]TIL48433.1 MAG: helix-turn-helix transcriptional regulator [Mesorhizobium sp.]TIL55448.1 MAG: helix-turn-helix transcriptional regulator [Mesorhizobium sp.]TIL84054.1 MAG: helix-turn-helix transcriptional regulator [Mesorhizobium sp.]
MAQLTPEACRAARGILKWSVRDLAEHAGIAFSTVHLFEKGETVREDSKAKMVAAFAAKHVEITNGDGTGARLKKLGVTP